MRKRLTRLGSKLGNQGIPPTLKLYCGLPAQIDVFWVEEEGPDPPLGLAGGSSPTLTKHNRSNAQGSGLATLHLQVSNQWRKLGGGVN